MKNKIQVVTAILDAGTHDNMSVYLSTIDWDKLFSYNLTVDSMWYAFSNVLYTAIDLFDQDHQESQKPSGQVLPIYS